METLFGENLTANSSGKETEEAIEAICKSLQRKGYIVVRQYPIGDKKIDIFVRGIKEYPDGLIISVKNQDVAGTAEQKLLYEIDVLHTDMGGKPSILLLVGNGFSQKVIDRIEMRRKTHYRRVVHMFRGIDEFLSWVKRQPKCDDNLGSQLRFDPVKVEGFSQSALGLRAE